MGSLCTKFTNDIDQNFENRSGRSDMVKGSLSHIPWFWTNLGET